MCLYIKTYNKQKYGEYKVYLSFLRTGTVEILIYTGCSKKKETLEIKHIVKI